MPVSVPQSSIGAETTSASFWLFCLVPRLPPGSLHDLQARPESRGGASGAVRSQAGAWERDWCTGGAGDSHVAATTIGDIVWFPGSRLGTSMIYRLGLNTEAEPRGPCVPRREPGNEDGASGAVRSQAGAWERVWCTVGQVTATTIGEIRMLG